MREVKGSRPGSFSRSLCRTRHGLPQERTCLEMWPTRSSWSSRATMAPCSVLPHTQPRRSGAHGSAATPGGCAHPRVPRNAGVACGTRCASCCTHRQRATTPHCLSIVTREQGSRSPAMRWSVPWTASSATGSAGRMGPARPVVAAVWKCSAAASSRQPAAAGSPARTGPMPRECVTGPAIPMRAHCVVRSSHSNIWATVAGW
mmetsp:Transcript_141614/g.394793  ORF Transcript_141614/g.394793 Transcript_141614/m.394793 type:complete len:203 (+) Transcript_141614:559-1167(+)